MKINTGKGQISLLTLLAIYSISMVSSLPGLAISPIIGELSNIFPNAGELKIQLLESLPSFIVIPFILLAGKLSLKLNKKNMLIAGLSVFFLCGIVYLFTNDFTLLLLISALLGIGAGVTVPFSTGLIADFFTGKYRVRQLGIASAINNLTLVIATFLVGFLADINWHDAFLVYLFSGISLIFVCFLKKDQLTQQNAAVPNPYFKMPYKWMVTYFIVTFFALVIPFNLSIYLDFFHDNSTTTSGTLISIYFLSIMLPGINIPKIISYFKEKTIIYAEFLMFIGIVCVSVSHHLWLIYLGAICCGIGYGIIQPIIYEHTANETDSKHATYALSWVMVMNYLAIFVYPFIMNVFPANLVRLPFISTAILAAIFGIIMWKYQAHFSATTNSAKK